MYIFVHIKLEILKVKIMTTVELERKNHTVGVFNFTDNKSQLKITAEDGRSIAILTVYRIEEEGIVKYLVQMGDSSFAFIELRKFADKYLAGYNDTKTFNGYFYTFQKRAKMYLKHGSVEERKTTPRPEVRKPEVKKEEVKKEERLPETRKTEFKAKTKKVGLEEQIFEMVAEGINDNSTTEIIVNTVKNKLDDWGIKPVNKNIIVENVTTGTKKEVGTQHMEFETIIQCLSARVPVALVGPAGSGKTTTAMKAAEAIGLKFYSKSVSAQTGSHEFFGYQDAHGKYVRTLFREAYETGGVFLLDEFDAGNPNVLAALNQATANGHMAFADGMVDKHDDFIVIMAGNTYGHGATSEYVGRNKIDAATLDRFSFIYFDYDEALETSLADNKNWTRKVQKIRKEVAKKKIKTIVSPRASINGSKLLATGMPEKKVVELLILKGLGDDERALLKSVI